MSGRSTQIRGGKRSQKNRGFDSSTTGQFRGGATRHSNDPPPRFAKRNGDVRSGRGEPKGSYHDYEGSNRGSENSGFKGRGSSGRSSLGELADPYLVSGIPITYMCGYVSNR